MAKEMHQIRQENFQWLFQQFRQAIWRDFPDEPEKGMLKRFADRLGLSDRYLSHINNARKGIGSTTARRIEEALKLERGWMDSEHEPSDPKDRAEQEFVHSALQLFRNSPVEAQAALLRYFREKLT